MSSFQHFQGPTSFSEALHAALEAPFQVFSLSFVTVILLYGVEMCTSAFT